MKSWQPSPLIAGSCPDNTIEKYSMQGCQFHTHKLHTKQHLTIIFTQGLIHLQEMVSNTHSHPISTVCTKILVPLATGILFSESLWQFSVLPFFLSLFFCFVLFLFLFFFFGPPGSHHSVPQLVGFLFSEKGALEGGWSGWEKASHVGERTGVIPSGHTRPLLSRFHCHRKAPPKEWDRNPKRNFRLFEQPSGRFPSSKLCTGEIPCWFHPDSRTTRVYLFTSKLANMSPSSVSHTKEESRNFLLCEKHNQPQREKVYTQRKNKFQKKQLPKKSQKNTFMKCTLIAKFHTRWVVSLPQHCFQIQHWEVHLKVAPFVHQLSDIHFLIHFPKKQKYNEDRSWRKPEDTGTSVFWRQNWLRWWWVFS